MKSEKEKTQKNTFYFFLLAYILAIVTLAIIFRPFIYSMIMGVVLGVFFFPLNDFLIRKGLKKNLSASLLVTLIFLIIIGSSYLFINSVVHEATQTYFFIASYDFSEVDQFLENYLGITISTRVFAEPIMRNIEDAFSLSLPRLLGSFAEIMVGLFFMLFLLFYIFKDGENIMSSVMNVLPVSNSHKDQIKKESRKVLYGVMYGQVLIAIIQGVLGGLAFFIFGIKNPVFWGFIMAVLAFIPLLGTPLVWAPAGLLQLINGNLVSGIGILLFGSLIMFSIENIVRPKYIGKKSGMHPLLVLLSIFGGIMLFGVLGLIIGPILVALCVLVIKIFNQEWVLNEENY